MSKQAENTMSAATADLFSLSFDALHAIACDLKHPQRDDADELLSQWEADDASRRTPAGGVRMSAPVDVLAFLAAADVLPVVSDDDCKVILQDWDETKPDQRTAMRLAAELLNARDLLREFMEYEDAERGSPNYAARPDSLIGRTRAALGGAQ